MKDAWKTYADWMDLERNVRGPDGRKTFIEMMTKRGHGFPLAIERAPGGGHDRWHLVSFQGRLIGITCADRELAAYAAYYLSNPPWPVPGEAAYVEPGKKSSDRMASEELWEALSNSLHASACYDQQCHTQDEHESMLNKARAVRDRHNGLYSPLNIQDKQVYENVDIQSFPVKQLNIDFTNGIWSFNPKNGSLTFEPVAANPS